jgi:hypothetical protein
VSLGNKSGAGNCDRTRMKAAHVYPLYPFFLFRLIRLLSCKEL